MITVFLICSLLLVACGNSQQKEGFIVNIYLYGLSENIGYQDIYVQRVQDCIDDNPLGVEEE